MFDGAKIIRMAREQLGLPELDADGIWCMLRGIFPEDFDFKLKSGKQFRLSCPYTMLNPIVHAIHQSSVSQSQRRIQGIRGQEENSIFFELDGPYKATILPSSKEEDKLLRKRYAVFNFDNSLAELEGFEVKRRGEL